MKRQIISLITCGLFVMAGYSQTKSKNFISENISFASQQLWNEVSKYEKSTKVMIPRSVYNHATGYTKITDWTSGFFPGSLWYMYDLTKQDKWKQAAIRYTLILDSVKYVKNNHDVGFMIECSYGNGLRLTNNHAYKAVIVEAAKSLITRYRPEAEIIQSWDTNKKTIEKGWVYPVIIDNMMNLELLFNATRYTGDSIYWKIAVQHDNTTLKNHFITDNRCYIFVNYSPK